MLKSKGFTMQIFHWLISSWLYIGTGLSLCLIWSRRFHFGWADWLIVPFIWPLALIARPFLKPTKSQ